MDNSFFLFGTDGETRTLKRIISGDFESPLISPSGMSRYNSVNQKVKQFQIVE
jgi:hypothetical protein